MIRKFDSNLGGSYSSPVQLVHDESVSVTEKSSLAQDTYERIKADIFAFRMPPGERYSEQALATMFGVSRTPLRFALHVLAHQGYLRRLEGHSSWQVTPLDLKYYEDLYDFRIDMEVLALRRLCTTNFEADLERLQEFWSVERDQRILDSEAVVAADEQFHTSLVALAGGQEMLRTYKNLTERIRIIRRLDFTSSTRITWTYEEHAEIISALLARQADVAEALIRQHIEATRTEIRNITLHMVALASPPDSQASANHLPQGSRKFR